MPVCQFAICNLQFAICNSARPRRAQREGKMSLNRSHILRLALKSIAVHPLRSVLTILGIFLGVASVIVMLAIGEAARYQAIQQIKDLGATNVIIRSVKPEELSKQQQGQSILTYGLTMEDLHRIRDTIPTVLSVTPLREFRKDARHLEHK